MTAIRALLARDARARRFGSWRRTAAWYRAPGVVALALGVGLATGRADVVILVAPLAIGWVLALMATRPMLGARAPRAVARVDSASFGSNIADVITTVSGSESVEFVSVAQPGMNTGPIGEMVTIPGGAPEQAVRSRFRTSSWGRTAVTRPDSLGVGPDGLYTAGQVRYAPARTEIILPAVALIEPVPLPALSGGWAGAHVSRRPGQGSDLVDLREFAPGDRLRQVHWRAYGRHQRLYTRRTLSDAEAELMICLDLSVLFQPRRQRFYLGAVRGQLVRLRGLLQTTTDRIASRRDPDAFAEVVRRRHLSTLSNIDHTVAAAAGIAAAHVRQGDRVGLMTATVPQQVVRPGVGDRHLQRIRHRLALIEQRRHRMLDASLWGLTPGQVVVWCSPLVSDQAFAAIAECEARGHLVIVVDTLPIGGLIANATVDAVDNLRVQLVDRELKVQGLKGRGVPVISWDEGDLGRQVIEAGRVLARRRR